MTTTVTSDIKPVRPLSVALFLTASIARRLAALIWIPLLISVLSPADFARFGLLQSSVLILVPLLSFNIMLSPQRLMFDFKTPSETASYLKTVMAASLLIPTAIGALVLLSLQTAGIQDDLTQGQTRFQFIVIGLVLATILNEFGFMILRATGRPRLFAANTLLVSFGQIGLFWGLFTWLDAEPLPAVGIAMATALLVSAATALISSRSMLSQGKIDLSLIGVLLAYSIPTALHTIGLWAINGSGRWVGTHFLSLEQLAPYTLLTMIAMFITSVPAAVFEARVPDLGKAFGSGDTVTGTRIVKNCVWIGLRLVILAYLVMAFIFYVVQPAFMEAYRPPKMLLFVIFFMNVAHCLYLRGVNTLIGLKRTGTLAIGTLLSGSLAFALAIPLCARYDELGLVFASVIGMIAQWQISCRLAEYCLNSHTLAAQCSAESEELASTAIANSPTPVI